jgi:stage IV sporulation protein B
VTVERGGKQRQIHIEPQITTDGPKLGVFLRQGITGIGTVTWYDPETDRFATLGHGVNDGKGKRLDMSCGNAYPARVVSVQKGKTGAPGQLKGALNTQVLLGRLTGNTERGVFGTAPDAWQGEAIPVGICEEVRTGPAVIRSTVDDGAPREYCVEIVKLYPKNRADGRNMLIHVTDPDLLEATGGIVQGMSGSPIIQDGKLVGAVTHVLVNDPTTGYGIFIENMLDAAA